MYIAFIDFRKAFDFIPYSKLWPILQETDIRGEMFQTIDNMYSIIKAHIRNGNTVTEAFVCHKGLKQG